uniref:Replication protein E1 n=1 Tax=Human papillomavirus TaxID=10566 RepID=A0A385PIQ8_9PAPI|nr:MAG: E1 protein [Human papillomavirus]
MGDPNKGTDSFETYNNADCWFVREAECVDSLQALDDLFEESTNGSVISNLIDDEGDQVDEGNSLALYNAQVTEDSERTLLELKRKYIKSPERTLATLSPRLEAVRISPRRPIKKRLFEDSGVGEDEAESVNEVFQVEENIVPNHAVENGAADNFLNCINKRAMILAKFKEKFGVPYSELTRVFKSDRTCTNDWVLTVYNVAEEVLQGSKILLQQHCSFLQAITFDFSALFLFEFKSAKNRLTIVKLMCQLFNCIECQIICDPPRIRSAPTAFYFYKKIISKTCFVFGPLPDWINRHCIVNHQMANAAENFDLSKMIQWAFDNDMVEDAEIAYHYALLADSDSNAAAFLNSNQQVKYVRDCRHMVTLYKRQQMKQMTMGQWIGKCCENVATTGDWRVIAKFLRHQNVNVISFLIHLKTFFKCIPKKNCLLIYGPPDTGKSYFCYTLLHFLKGKVVSYMNKNSVFWLQPLHDCKIGYIDDATYAAWLHIDVNMRGALDGNHICLDSKHKAPTQTKLPPLMITSNHDVINDQSLMYLHSRITAINFPNQMPLTNEGLPLYDINDATWKSFFTKLSRQLDLTFEEEGDESGGPDRAFRCTAGGAAEPN